METGSNFKLSTSMIIMLEFTNSLPEAVLNTNIKKSHNQLVAFHKLGPIDGILGAKECGEII